MKQLLKSWNIINCLLFTCTRAQQQEKHFPAYERHKELLEGIAENRCAFGIFQSLQLMVAHRRSPFYGYLERKTRHSGVTNNKVTRFDTICR
jgi:hypothetical protein